MSKKNRKNRTLKVESLENRELMAADVTATLSAGTLQITGTDRAEMVRVNQVRDNITVSIGYGRPFAAFPATAVQKLSLNMKAGNDSVEVNLQRQALDSIFVQMGLGSKERVDLGLGSVNSVTINAVESLASTVIIEGTVKNKAAVDFGNDSSGDSLRVVNSSVGNLDVKMGGGNDLLTLHRSRVDRAVIDMGSGDDTFTNSWNSEVVNGTIDGGTAVRGNRWSGARFGRGVRISGF